jgi:exonuclease III
MEAQSIIDIWRVQHPNERQYTYRGRNPYPIHCRLDMCLVSDSIQGFVECSSIAPGYGTDHSLIGINCDQHQNDSLIPDLYWKMLKM